MALILLSHNTPDTLVTSLDELGFDTLKMPSMPDMAAPVSSHPDMLLFVGFGRLFARASHLQNEEFRAAIDAILEKFPSLTLTPTSDLPSETYPDDIAFNCLMIGKKGIFGKADYLSGALKRYATEAMLPIIDISQGYTKCSSLLIEKDGTYTVVTADPSICKALTQLGISTVKLTPGSITLPGYDTGFIGGASFYHNNTIYFLGDVKKHPSYDIIKKEADAHGVSVVSVSDEQLFDAGCLIIE